MERQTRTPDEIKKGLMCCWEDGCANCPYDDDCEYSAYVYIARDALSYIRQLEADLAAAKRERDAALADMRKLATTQIPCDVCSNDHRNDPVCKRHQGDCSECGLHCPCDGCFDDWEMRIMGNNFAWRGGCPENTEEDKLND